MTAAESDMIGFLRTSVLQYHLPLPDKFLIVLRCVTYT